MSQCEQSLQKCEELLTDFQSLDGAVNHLKEGNVDDVTLMTSASSLDVQLKEKEEVATEFLKQAKDQKLEFDMDTELLRTQLASFGALNVIEVYILASPFCLTPPLACFASYCLLSLDVILF